MRMSSQYQYEEYDWWLFNEVNIRSIYLHFVCNQSNIYVVAIDPPVSRARRRILNNKTSLSTISDISTFSLPCCVYCSTLRWWSASSFWKPAWASSTGFKNFFVRWKCPKHLRWLQYYRCGKGMERPTSNPPTRPPPEMQWVPSGKHLLFNSNWTCLDALKATSNRISASEV